MAQLRCSNCNQPILVQRVPPAPCSHCGYLEGVEELVELPEGEPAGSVTVSPFGLVDGCWSGCGDNTWIGLVDASFSEQSRKYDTEFLRGISWQWFSYWHWHVRTSSSEDTSIVD